MVLLGCQQQGQVLLVGWPCQQLGRCYLTALSAIGMVLLGCPVSNRDGVTALSAIGMVLLGCQQ